MLGTIVNTCAILAGSVAGSLVRRGLKEEYQSVLFTATGLAGTALDLNGRFQRLTQARAGQGSRLGEGLSTAVLLFCIGTLSILGPVNSALYGDNTYLFTNATLDLVTSMVLAFTYGIGIAIAAAVLFCWQGAIYLLATLAGLFLSDTLMCEVSIVGGFLIASSGIGILGLKDCKTLNLLPALAVPVLWCLAAGALGI